MFNRTKKAKNYYIVFCNNTKDRYKFIDTEFVKVNKHESKRYYTLLDDGYPSSLVFNNKRDAKIEINFINNNLNKTGDLRKNLFKYIDTKLYSKNDNIQFEVYLRKESKHGT